MKEELRKILKEFDLLATGFDWWNHKPKPQKAREWLRHALTEAYEVGRKEEREKIVKLIKRRKSNLIDCNVGWKHKKEIDDLINHLV